jgi:type IX secretion system PorP/SprF family membrane protein
MKKIIYFFIFLIATAPILIAQDVHFSLYGEAPSVINPALTGVAYDFRANLNYKSQWSGFNSGFLTYAANIESAIKHQKLKKSYFAFGVNFYNDVSGDSKFVTTSFSGNLSAIVKTGKNSKLSLGLTGGALSRRIGEDQNLTWESQYDGFKYQETFTSGEKNFYPTAFTRADFGGGINWHYSESNLFISSENGTRIDAGVSAYHFTTPKNSFFIDGNDKTNMRYIAYATAVLCKKDSPLNLKPGMIFQRQGKTQQVILSTMIRYIVHEQSIHSHEQKAFAIAVGMQYRLKDAIIPAFLLEYDKFALGLAYDYNPSNLSPASKSKQGYEFSLRYCWNPGYGKMVGSSSSAMPSE